MKSIKKIVTILAICYVILSLIQALLLPPNFIGFVDNLLFVFGLAVVIQDSITNKHTRKILFTLSLFSVWAVLSHFIRGGADLLGSLSYYALPLKWLVIIAVSYIVVREVKMRQYAFLFLDISFVLLVVLNLLLALNPGGFGEFLQHIYSPSNYSDFVYYHEPGSFRLAGTQLNPNDNAIIWACFILLYGQRLSEKWPFVILAVGLLLLTQSRTIVLALALISFFYLVRFIIKRREYKKLLVFGLPMMVFGFIIVLKSSYLLSLFNGDAFRSISFLSRLENYQYLSTYSFNELLIGKGVISNPAETLGFSIDSEFLGVVFQFGLIGLACWFTILIVFLSIGRLKNELLFSLLVLIALTSFTNYTFLNLQIAVVLSLFVGVSLGANKLIK